MHCDALFSKINNIIVSINCLFKPTPNTMTDELE